jgi:hypothetical protein
MMMPEAIQPMHAGTGALSLALITTESVLELIVPPVGHALDTHAPWHITTVPLAIMCYNHGYTRV